VINTLAYYDVELAAIVEAMGPVLINLLQ
jgi:hypothetical protein